MSKLFLDIFNISITASWLIAAVLIVRLVLKRCAPKWTLCLLWAVVGLRLVVSFSFESDISLVPSGEAIKTESVYAAVAQSTVSVGADNSLSEKPPVGDTEISSGEAVGDISTILPETDNSASTPALPETDITVSVPLTEPDTDNTVSAPEVNIEYIDFGFDAIDEPLNKVISEKITEAPQENPVKHAADIASNVWVFGMIAMMVYAVVNYLLLKRRVAVSVPDADNVRRSEAVGSPFILGIFRPKIYLPFGLDINTEAHILAHERAHLKRRDHFIKPIGYAVLTVYWFNPLVWLAYILLCRDIELACDEKVVKNMNAEARKAYASALLECGIKRSVIAACPVAFGEIGVKQRVKNALNYKKPMFWIIIVAVVACIAVSLLFLTNPADGNDASNNSDISDVSDTSDISDNSGTELGENTMLMTIAGTDMGAKPFEDHSCFYAYGSNGKFYRVFWTDFTGLAEKTRVNVKYSKIEDTPNYDATLTGGYNPKYEMTAASVEIVPDETEKLEYKGYVFDGVFGEGIDGVNRELSDKDALSIYAIRTQDELDEFLESWKSSVIFVDVDGSFSDYVDKLPDGFFEENAMIAVPVAHSSTPAYYTFVDVERRRDEIILSISYDVSSAMATAIQQNTLVAVVKKSDIEGCDSYSVVPIDISEEIRYSNMSRARKSIGQEQVDISESDAGYLVALLNSGEWTNGIAVCRDYDWLFPSDVFYDSRCGIFIDTLHDKALILDENERDAVNKILSAESDTSDNRFVYDATPRDIAFTEHFFFGEIYEFDAFISEDTATESVEMSIYYEKTLVPVVIDSVEKCELLIKSNIVDDAESKDYLKSLTEDFFKNNILLVNDFFISGMCDYRSVDNVFINENGVNIKYSFDEPEPLNAFADHCIVITEVSLKDVYGHRNFNAEVQIYEYGEHTVYDGDVLVKYASEAEEGLSAENAEVCLSMLNNGNWVDAVPECDTDWVFTVGNKTLFYHSSCGTFVARENQRSLSLSDSEQARLNGILSFDDCLAEFESDKIIEIKVSSLPGGYNYDFHKGDENPAIEYISDYLSNLTLESDFPENPDGYVGMTWVVTLIYEDNSAFNIYHFGNRFIRAEGGEWYRMTYDEASRFDELLSELNNIK